jgi:hypothetical protein
LIACLVLVLAAGPDAALALEPGAEAAPPPAATAWSCTAETLASGALCVFEGSDDAPPDRGGEELAAEACARAARPGAASPPDAAVLELCTARFRARARECAAAGAPAAVDARGRFPPSARACYAALAEVLAGARTMAALGGRCCACLAANGCARSAVDCNRDLARGTMPDGARRCFADACAEACGRYAPPPAAEPRDSAGPPAPGAPSQPTFQRL